MTTKPQRYFEDVRIGEELPPLKKHIDQVHMVMYQAATWDFHRYHYDADWVRSLGWPAPFVDGQHLGPYLAQLVIDWAGGDPGALKRLHFRFRNFVYAGDTLTCHGKVVDKRVEGGRHLVDCDLWIENRKGETVLAPGGATLDLPPRRSRVARR